MGTTLLIEGRDFSKLGVNARIHLPQPRTEIVFDFSALNFPLNGSLVGSFCFD